MSDTLRKQVIHLAFQNEHLRPHLLPLLRKSGSLLDILMEGKTPEQEAEQELQQELHSALIRISTFLDNLQSGKFSRAFFDGSGNPFPGKEGKDQRFHSHNFIDGLRAVRAVRQGKFKGIEAKVPVRVDLDVVWSERGRAYTGSAITFASGLRREIFYTKGHPVDSIHKVSSSIEKMLTSVYQGLAKFL